MKYYATRISENISETPEGYLLCIGVAIGRTGVMEYGSSETPLQVGPTGIVKVAREASEVFSEATMASFEGKPFTIGHPAEFVTPDNWKELAVGLIQNIRRDGDDLVCDLLITDAQAIELVKSGVRGLSCGYEAEYTQTGEGEGIQTHIVGNHLALVDEGRAGPSYEIKDHKGVSKMKKFAETMKKAFSTAVDEAMEKEEKKDDKAKDAEEAPAKPSYDELVKVCNAMMEKMDSIITPKAKDDNAAGGETAEVQAQPKAKDDEMEGIKDRLKMLEDKLAKLMEGESEEAGDDDEEEESEDEDMEVMTGDVKSRAEVLSPGIKATKDVKAEALKAAYATADGKAIIDTLTGGEPKFDKPEVVDTLFVAAAEMLKSKRGGALADAMQKGARVVDGLFQDKHATFVSADEVNKKMEAFYKKEIR